jgi:hypothetical protein
MRTTIAIVCLLLLFTGCVTEEGGNAWVKRDPVQCRGNAWELWEHAEEYSAEEELLEAYYLSEHGVEILEVQGVSWGDVPVCLACNCPRGDTLYVLVSREDSVAMLDLGWGDG